LLLCFYFYVICTLILLSFANVDLTWMIIFLLIYFTINYYDNLDDHIFYFFDSQLAFRKNRATHGNTTSYTKRRACNPNACSPTLNHDVINDVLLISCFALVYRWWTLILVSAPVHPHVLIIVKTHENRVEHILANITNDLTAKNYF
jgi:hypothetical protein